MIKQMYTIKDQKTHEFLHPFITINDETAIRDFYNTMSNIPLMRDHPKDFDLYSNGYFDTETGEIDKLQSIQFITSGLNCIELINQEAKPDETTKVSNDAPIQPST